MRNRSDDLVLRANPTESLSLEEMRARLPAIFAEQPHESRSQRYVYISTAEILEELVVNGYVPVEAHVFGMEIPLRRIYSLNPLVRIVGAFRDVLYDLRFPPLWDIAYVLLWAISMVVIGMWVFGKLDRRLAEEV